MMVQVMSVTSNDKGEASISSEGGFSFSMNGKQLGELFWQMDGEQQAQFFETLGEIYLHEGYVFDLQMAYMQDELGESGRRLLLAIAEEVREADGYKD